MKLEQLENRQLLNASHDMKQISSEQDQSIAECSAWLMQMGTFSVGNFLLGALVEVKTPHLEILSPFKLKFLLATSVGTTIIWSNLYDHMPFAKGLSLAIVSGAIGAPFGNVVGKLVGTENVRAVILAGSSLMAVAASTVGAALESLAEEVCSTVEHWGDEGSNKKVTFHRS